MKTEPLIIDVPKGMRVFAGVIAFPTPDGRSVIHLAISPAPSVEGFIALARETFGAQGGQVLQNGDGSYIVQDVAAAMDLSNFYSQGEFVDWPGADEGL